MDSGLRLAYRNDDPDFPPPARAFAIEFAQFIFDMAGDDPEAGSVGDVSESDWPAGADRRRTTGRRRQDSQHRE